MVNKKLNSATLLLGQQRRRQHHQQKYKTLGNNAISGAIPSQMLLLSDIRFLSLGMWVEGEEKSLQRIPLFFNRMCKKKKLS